MNVTQLSSGNGAAPVRAQVHTSGQSNPTPNSGGPTDSVTLSDEAQETAAVDPNRCNNDWRCLEKLQERGLLG